MVVSKPVISDAPTVDTGTRRWWMLAPLCLGMLLSLFEGAAIGVAVPTLTTDLHASTAEIQWTVNAFSLAFGGLVITCGGLADRFGRRRVWLLGVGLFAAGCVLAMVSTAAWQLIVARATLGVSTALVIPSSFALVGGVFDETERPRVTGIMAMAAGFGQAFSPLLAGYLLTNFRWGSLYTVALLMTVVCLVAGWWLLPRSGGRYERPADLVGALLSIATFTVLIWALINGPAKGWLSPGPAGAMCVGVLLLGLFLVRERASANPMLDLSLFRRRRFSAAVIAGLVPGFGLSGVLFLVSQYLQFQLGFTPWEVGLAMVPFAVAILLSAGLLSARLGRVLGQGTAMAGALTVAGLGLCGFGLFAATSGVITVLLILVCVGVGVGVCSPLANAMLLTALPEQRMGVGTGTNSTVGQLGSALGVAVIGAAFTAGFANALPADVPPDAARSVPAALDAAKHLQNAPAVLPAVHDAFGTGLSIGRVIGGAALIAGAGVVAALLRSPRKALDGRW